MRDFAETGVDVGRWKIWRDEDVYMNEEYIRVIYNN